MKPKPIIPPPPRREPSVRYTVIIAQTLADLQAQAAELIELKMEPQGGVHLTMIQPPQGANPPQFLVAQAFFRPLPIAGRLDPSIIGNQP